jgi:hypothetical protein
LADLERDVPVTLRAACEELERRGGLVEVESGRVIVRMPKQALGAAPWVPTGPRPGARIAAIVYACESEILEAARSRNGRVEAKSLSARGILPSGRLMP